MFKTIALIVVLLIAALLIFAATRPDTFAVRRGIDIQAPPEKIYPLINDLQRFQSWSPYEKKDPAMKRTLSGPPQGAGAVYEWDGNKDIGAGRLTIREAQPSSRVVMLLDFVRPFEAHNTVEFTLEPQAGGTRVNWHMHGPSPYISKLMGVIFNMDRMVGTDFEVGLADLKALAET